MFTISIPKLFPESLKSSVNEHNANVEKALASLADHSAVEVPHDAPVGIVIEASDTRYQQSIERDLLAKQTAVQLLQQRISTLDHLLSQLPKLADDASVELTRAKDKAETRLSELGITEVTCPIPVAPSGTNPADHCERYLVVLSACPHVASAKSLCDQLQSMFRTYRFERKATETNLAAAQSELTSFLSTV